MAKTAAFTVRFRKEAGNKVTLRIIPTAGSGLSAPCCTVGHDTEEQASMCGMLTLHRRLTAED